MEVIHDDLWYVKADAKCITTNGCVGAGDMLVMGAGIALQAREKFPGIQKALGQLVATHGNRVFPLDTSGIVAPGYCLVSFPTKNEWYHKACLKLIKKSAEELAELIKLRGWKRTLLAAPGVGEGGLEWRDVERVVEPILKNRNVIIMRKRNGS